jgi:hypothetical protein
MQALTKTHIFGLKIHSSVPLGSVNWSLVNDKPTTNQHSLSSQKGEDNDYDGSKITLPFNNIPIRNL